MKLKKALICVLSISILSACGNQEAEEKPKAVEETQQEVKEGVKPEGKKEAKGELVKENENSETVEELADEKPNIAIKNHDLISGGGEKVGTMSASIAQESQITDGYIKQ